jgi:thioredoxin reductase
MTLQHNGIDNVAVAIIGGGPAGLTAAATLAPLVDGNVLVIEREAETGGIPRHSDHPGYGIRDLRRSISGPAYARRLTDSALAAGAQLETEAMVTGWSGERRLQVTSPRGRRVVQADAVVLATGARERPRPARLIPGDRPDGVYTTGQLQNLVHLHHADVGSRAVIVGAELVSWSAVLTLREAGCSTVAMTSTYPAAEAYAAFRIPGRFLLKGPVLTRTRVVSITGKHRVESVTVENLDTGTRSTIACDTVITTGDWIPDHELARTGGLAIDAGTHGPLVDTALRTSACGVFAIGNLLHPVDTADIAALDGRHVAETVLAYLRGVPAPADGVRLLVDPPLRWISPGLIRPGDTAPARARLLLWSDEFVRFPTVRLRQHGTEIARRRVPWPAAPGRVFRIPAGVLDRIDARGGPVTVSLT